VTLFASIFQLYFYNDVGVVVDMVSHLSALLLFAYFIWNRERDIALLSHFITILLATILSMFSYEIYRFHNMQYEIRESIIVLSALLIFIELVQKEKSKNKTSFKL
jgi:membrane protein YdbS with pleckstrin-like domain